jgi:hypothetical protein
MVGDSLTGAVAVFSVYEVVVLYGTNFCYRSGKPNHRRVLQLATDRGLFAELVHSTVCHIYCRMAPDDPNDRNKEKARSGKLEQPESWNNRKAGTTEKPK